MPKVFCASLNSDNGPHLEILSQNGFEVNLTPPGTNLFDEETLIQHVSDCHAVVAGSERYSRKVIAASPNLRVIARSGVGYDAVDLDACDESQIAVTTTPGVNHHAVAEHTIALLMAVGRGFPELDRQVREDRWKRVPRPRIMGRTLGIVGLGRIGRAVATRAAGLGMNLVAFDPYANREFAEQWRIELMSFDDLLRCSDFVSLHLPMSKESHHLMNAETFAKMKPGSVLINTARGLLVDEVALNEALGSGHLRGAGLDVFEDEPLALSSPLLKHNNVLLSGHVAGLDNESHDDTFAMVANTIVALQQGEWPAECIQNLKGITSWKW